MRAAHWRRVFALLIFFSSRPGQAVEPATRPGLLDATDRIPIAVWLQDPSRAQRYKAIGINLYVGLWAGPKEDQLTALEKAGMPVICSQNAEALLPRWKSLVLGFMQNDEPDNAQEIRGGKGYGPPITPEKIVERYEKMKSADPRPVLLNLGQGVAYDNYIGRGVRRNHLEDYPLYVNGGDVVSFDIYPTVNESAEVAGKLWYVGRGVERLVKWTDGKRPVWSCIECTHVGNPKVKPTPTQVRAEVWMALIHGARGIIYFAHQFQPKFIEAGLLADAEMAEAVKQINAQVQEVAPALLSAPPARQATVEAEAGAVAVTTRAHAGNTYVFAVGMSDKNVTARFKLPGVTGPITVLGEQRTLNVNNGAWSDAFDGYAVHLYVLGSAP
jgi:hypothetical protein